MKRTLFAGLVLAAGAVSATALYAQPGDGPGRGQGRGPGPGGPGPGGPGPGGPGGPGRGMPSPIIAALDTDKDGVISAEEIENAAKSLKTLDRNGDGKLTPEELRPQWGFGGPGLEFDAEAVLDRAFQADGDGDGKITKDEAPSRMRENFDRIDADGDGSVTKEEFKAAIERMRQGAGRGPREGGDRGPREGGDRGPREGGEREGGDREGRDRGPSEGDSSER